MNKFLSLKEASIETGLAEYTLRQLCKGKKIRFNLAGNTKYILRIDWLETDLEKLAVENMSPDDGGSVSMYGQLRQIKK